MTVRPEATQAFAGEDSQQWVHIALDDTPEPATLRARGELCQVLVIHMKILRLAASNGPLQKLSTVLPTALLKGTSRSLKSSKGVIQGII